MLKLLICGTVYLAMYGEFYIVLKMWRRFLNITTAERCARNSEVEL